LCRHAKHQRGGAIKNITKVYPLPCFINSLPVIIPTEKEDP